MGDVTIEVLDGALGLLPVTGDEVHAVIGCSSAGEAGTIVATKKIERLIASRGLGPGVQAAAFAIKQTGKTVLFCKVASSTPGKVTGSDAAAINIDSSTNATPIVVTTGAAHGLATGAMVVIASHLVNTAANGTWAIEVLSPTTFELVGSVGNGVGVNTGTIQPTGVSIGSSAGTSEPTLTGVPIDSQSFRWKWVKGGTRGAAGAVFQYSRDGGLTWSAELAIGSATSYEIEDTGLTIAFSAGTWVAGDEYRWKTTQPQWTAADVTAVIDLLGQLDTKFRMIHLVGDLDAADATTFTTDVEALTEEKRWVRMLGHARDFVAADEDEAGWEEDLADDFSSFEANRVAVAAGFYPITSPIDGSRYRRPASFAVAARIMARPIQEHAGRVRTGSLKGLATPTDAEIVSLDLETQIHHNSKNSDTLKNARFITLRTRVGRKGWFVDSPRTMSSPSSDYQLLPHCFVVDKTCDLTYEVLVDYLNDDLQVDDEGKILEKEAKSIESRLNSTYRDGLTSKRAASRVAATIDRDTNILSTKKMAADVRVRPRGFAEDIEVTVGLENPALDLG